MVSKSLNFQCACGSTDRYKSAKGMCAKCYGKHNKRANAERSKKVRKVYMLKNAESIREANKAYAAARPEWFSEQRVKNNAKRNGKPRFDVKARKKRVRLATPRNLSFVHRKQIIDFYRNRPEGHHVDHIVPLNGRAVSGLHVPWNLQYLPASVNLRKGCRA